MTDDTTDCAERFEELTGPRDVVLGEDLASLSRLPERERIERYNQLKQNEEEFRRTFTEECADFFTDAERDRVRSDFRLARLLVAASFYATDDLPRALEDDFTEAELQAVVDFEEYSEFDVLTEEEIEERIRRMEGEVYELVSEYTSTQLANVESLIEDPDVQGDVLRRLLDRYEERREKIRRGFFTYVETHGLERMVEGIESAVRSVSRASSEREAVLEELREVSEEFSTEAAREVRSRTRELDARIDSLERRRHEGDVDPADFEREREEIGAALDDLRTDREAAIEEIQDRLERTRELAGRLDDEIADLEAAREDAEERVRATARSETADVIEDELEDLGRERDRVGSEIERLERELEELEAGGKRLRRRYESLETQDLPRGDPDPDALDDDAVTSSMARLLEMDYLGRVDTSLHETPEVHTPDGAVDLPDGYWNGRVEHRSERGRLERLLPEGRDPDRYPMNRRVRYEVASAGLLGLSRDRELVIDVGVVSNLAAHAHNGFDAEPAGLDTLLSQVNEAVSEAEASGHHVLLCLASTTGWTDRVRDRLEAGDRTRFSRHLSLCLVDLRDGSLLYDESDEVIDANADCFELSTPTERIEACVETIRSEYVEPIETQSVVLEEVVESTEFAPHVVRRAFERLEEEGVGEALHVEGHGLSLDFR